MLETPRGTAIMAAYLTQSGLFFCQYFVNDYSARSPERNHDRERERESRAGDVREERRKRKTERERERVCVSS